MSGPKVKQDTALPLLFDNRIRAMAAANGPGAHVRGTLGTGGRRLRSDGLRSAAAQSAARHPLGSRVLQVTQRRKVPAERL